MLATCTYSLLWRARRRGCPEIGYWSLLSRTRNCWASTFWFSAGADPSQDDASAFAAYLLAQVVAGDDAWAYPSGDLLEGRNRRDRREAMAFERRGGVREPLPWEEAYPSAWEPWVSSREACSWEARDRLPGAGWAWNLRNELSQKR